MQLTNALCVAILAVTVTSTALPEACGNRGQGCWKDKRVALPEADPIAEACGNRGQGCWKIKRAGIALREALAEPATGELQARCEMVGGACFFARKLARDLADTVAATQDDSEDYYASLNIEDADEAAKARVKREAEACGHRGQGCWKEKRMAEAEAEAEACGNRGQGCWKEKRNAEALAEAEACGNRGQGCWKVKRAAEAIAEAVAEAEPCGNRGQGCWKEKRDFAALQFAARDALAKL